MKVFQRPEYSFFRQGASQVYSQLSLDDLILLLSTMTDVEKAQAFIYHPSWDAWKPSQEVPEVKVEFVFQRNVKAPPPQMDFAPQPQVRPLNQPHNQPRTQPLSQPMTQPLSQPLHQPGQQTQVGTQVGLAT